MLTSTAGELSSDAASAAPVASARTFDTDTPASGWPAAEWGSFSFPATRRWRPKRKTFPNIVVCSTGRAGRTTRALLGVSAVLTRRSRFYCCVARDVSFTSIHGCVNIVFRDPAVCAIEVWRSIAQATITVEGAGMETATRAATAGKSGDTATAIAVLRQRFGDRLQTGEAIRRQHANTITWIPNQPPDAVIWVENRDEVREVVRVAGTHRVPIVPYGAGTSLEGHINAPRGGLSLDFSRMNRVLAVNERDLDCVVEPGVSRKQLNDYLREMGLFFPVDPGAEEATIGGMAATRASGTNAVRYGTMRENVLNLTAVMADGSVVKTAQRARKSAAGYDLTRLLVGSEGTLGIITEVTVRLYGIPERILSAVCPFATLEGACNAVILSIQ